MCAPHSQGVSRSSSCVMAFLMATRDEAYDSTCVVTPPLCEQSSAFPLRSVLPCTRAPKTARKAEGGATGPVCLHAELRPVGERYASNQRD